MSLSFKNFKKEFYSKFTDYKIFEGEEFNYFKIALEGLKVDYFQKGKFSISIFYPNFKYYIFYFINRFKKIINGEISRFNSHLEISKTNKSPEYLIIDPGRAVKNSEGDLIPIYFSKTYESLKKHHSVFYVSEKSIPNYDGFNDIYSDLISLGNSIKHSFSDSLREEIKEVFTNINNNSNFNSKDLNNIKCAFQKFYNEAIFWLNILESLKPENVLMICHYHKEGLIFAAKKLNINIIEYQHGLIAKSDIFYNFPHEVKEIKKDCLFPNEIRTYGRYWKNILINGNFINEENVKITKYFLYSRLKLNSNELNSIDLFRKKRKIILITTQTYLTDIFIKYIDSLLEILENDYCVVIKPHPQEKTQSYNKYIEHDSVFLTDLPTEGLFLYSSLHITMYSTTAFDALRYDLPSYYIYSENQSDYINEIHNAIGGEIIYDFNSKPWEIENKIKVNLDEFFYHK